MKLHTLDEIVRGALMARGYPMHWYIQFLYYAKNGLREVSLDSLNTIKSVKLPVSNYKAFKLPCDWVDFVRVGLPKGNGFDLYEPTNGFIRHYNRDASNNKIAWPASTDTSTAPVSIEGLSYSLYINDKGEHNGRVFNAVPEFTKTYMVMKERDEAQLHPSFEGSEIYVDYITDGVGVDACNAVPPYAYQTIMNYIFWQQKLHGRQYSPSEREEARNEFYHEYKRLRSRIAAGELTTENIIRSLRKATNATIKG